MALYFVAVVVSAGVVIYPHKDAIVQTATGILQGSYGGDLLEAEFLSRGVDALTEKIGHDMVNDITVSSTRISVDAPLVAGQKKSDQWTYRKSLVTNTGAASIQPSTELEQFSTGDVAWETMWSAVQEVATEEGLDAKEAIITVSREADNDVSSDTFAQSTGPIRVLIMMRDDYHSVTYEVNPDGSGLELITES